MEETVFFSEGKTLISSTRIDIDGQTFAVRNIGSVKLEGNGLSVWAVGFLLIGAGMALNPEARSVGVAFVLIGGALTWMRMSVRKLVLVTGGGEVTAYETRNRALAERLRSAVSSAIAAR